MDRAELEKVIAESGHAADFKPSKYLNSDQNDHERSQNITAWRTVLAPKMAEAVHEAMKEDRHKIDQLKAVVFEYRQRKLLDHRYCEQGVVYPGLDTPKDDRCHTCERADALLGEYRAHEQMGEEKE